MDPLIGTEQLSSNLDAYRVCDLRWDLIDPAKGRAAYQMGHIPGAVFVDLDVDLAAAPGMAGRHPLPDITEFAATLGRLGIDPASHVVAYDDVGGRVAARLWWMLTSIGHEAVAVLDGGYQAWVDAGHDIGVGVVSPTPTVYPVPDGFSGVVTRDQLQGRALIDARAGNRYRGEVEPVDPKAGHIPGAVNIPNESNLGHDGRFLDPRALAAIYSEVDERGVVYCGSGVNACHDALAMVLAGRELPDVYVGSFSEWSRHDLPVATGADR
jgi:thiosulfate/3-mercaptopyruvate sulfurtransferase